MLFGYGLIETTDIAVCADFNSRELCSRHGFAHCNCGDMYCDECEPALRLPKPIAHIPEFIMLQLIDEGFVVESMSDNEWNVQIALGTAPAYRQYLIPDEVVA